MSLPNEPIDCKYLRAIPVGVSKSEPAEPLYWRDKQVPITHTYTVRGRPPQTQNCSYTIPGLVNTLGLAAGLGYERVKQWDKNAVVRSDGIVCLPTSSRKTSVSVTLTTQGGTRFLTSKEVEGFDVVLSMPRGVYQINTKKGFLDHEVSVAVLYRKHQPTVPNAPWTVAEAEYIISGTQRAEIIKTIKAGRNLPMAVYEILVFRHTADHTGSAVYVDDIYVKEITEIIYAQLQYNHTALLGLRIRATDQLHTQLPTVTSLVKGIKVSVPTNVKAAYQNRYLPDGNYNKEEIDLAYAQQWDGLLDAEKVWTDNPVWCLYDLLMNPRYGLAEYYPISPEKLGLMQANFYLMARYCDEAIEYTDTTGAQNVTRYRPRFACNLVIDQTKSASEWVSTFAALMRAVVFYAEGVFWIDIDRPKPITQLFTMSNITNYSQTATSYKQIPNSYEVQWINPLTNYEIDAFKVESTDLQTNPRIEERRKALMLLGVTNFDQAKSVAQYALLAGKYRNKYVTFKTGTNALRCSVTDIIGIQHDVPQWNFGGSVISYNIAIKRIIVDTPIDLSASNISLGTPLAVKIAHGIDSIETYAVADAGTFDTYEGYIDLVNYPATHPAPHEQFVLGPVESTIDQFKVLSIRRDSDDLCEIKAVDYDPEMFKYCDNTAGLGEYVTTDYSIIANPMRASVNGVHAYQKFTQTPSGVWATSVDVFYNAPARGFWQEAQVHYAKVGTGQFVNGQRNSSGKFELHDLEVGSYQIVITSIYTQGKQTIQDALADFDNHPWAIIDVSAFAPNDDFLIGVTGLEIENKANDGTFDGRDCIIVWRKPLVIGEAADAGTEVAGAGTTNTNEWLSHYEVKIIGREGQIRRTVDVPTERFVYTYEMNYQDSYRVDGDADRFFTVSVTAVDKVGRKSVDKAIECYNPAPPKIGG